MSNKTDHSKEMAFHWIYENYMREDKIISDFQSGKITSDECSEIYYSKKNDFLELCDRHIEYSGKILLYALSVFSLFVGFLFYASVYFEPYTYQATRGICHVEPKNLFMIFVGTFAVLFWGVLIFGSFVQGHLASYMTYSAAKKAAQREKLFV